MFHGVSDHILSNFLDHPQDENKQENLHELLWSLALPMVVCEVENENIITQKLCPFDSGVAHMYKQSNLMVVKKIVVMFVSTTLCITAEHLSYRL